MPVKEKKGNRYSVLIGHIFFRHWKKGITEFEFTRPEIAQAATALKMVLPKNVGDIVYATRYRTPLPPSIIETQPNGQEWIIEGSGHARYRFRLVKANRIRPREDMLAISIPDATPEVIQLYRLDDEQALLAIVRYNRLIDIFLGLTTYSLQNHLRTSVKGVGQIEIDELYVGLDKRGCHYVIPVQAKGGRDQVGIVQINQDIRYCEQKFPGMRCKPVAAQFMPDKTIALFELELRGGDLKVAEEKHYRLVPANEIDEATIRTYRN